MFSDRDGMTAIKDFFKTYQDAAWHKDTSAMINLYDEQAVIFDMWDQGYCVSSSDWNKAIKDWLSSLGTDRVKVEFDMIKISESGAVGFATALIKYSALSNEGAVLRSMKNRITLGFSKSSGTWKVIHQHTSAHIRSNGLTAILDI